MKRRLCQEYVHVKIILILCSSKGTNEMVMSLCQDRSRVRFQRGDACSLPLDIGQFDCVLASNIICRLHTPHAFLDRLPSLVSAGGVLVITSPYTFQTQFTARVCAVC